MWDALPLAVILPCIPALRGLPVPGEHQWAKVLESHRCVCTRACMCQSVCISSFLPRNAAGLACEKVLLDWLICFLGTRSTSLVYSVNFNRAVAGGAVTLSSEVTFLRLHGAAQASVVLGASPPHLAHFKGDHCT